MRRRMTPLLLISGAAALLFWLGCGSTPPAEEATNDGSTEIPTFRTIDELPSATGGMADAVEATTGSANKPLAATTGRLLREVEESDINEEMSHAACETTNLIIGGIGTAAELDLFPCYIKMMHAAGTFEGHTIDDGSWHLFDVSVPGSGTFPARIKLKIDKDDDEAIDSFQLYTCIREVLDEETGELGDPELFQYVEVTVDERTLTQRGIAHIGGYEEGDTPDISVVDLTGTMNGSGAFLQKEIAVQYRRAAGEAVEGGISEPNRWLEGTIMQTPGTFAFEGYRYHLESNVAHAAGMISAGEMLGDTFPGVSRLAIGDGSANFAVVDATGTELASGIESWLGDDLSLVEPASSGIFYSAIVDATPAPTSMTMPELAFNDRELWDCTDDGSGIAEVIAPRGTLLRTHCSSFAHQFETFTCPSIDLSDIPETCTSANVCHENLGDACPACFESAANLDELLECVGGLCPSQGQGSQECSAYIDNVLETYCSDSGGGGDDGGEGDSGDGDCTPRQCGPGAMPQYCTASEFCSCFGCDAGCIALFDGGTPALEDLLTLCGGDGDCEGGVTAIYGMVCE